MKKQGISKTTEYRTWSGMKARCYNTKSKAYKNYGGRGIKVCDRWLNSFDNFLSDMGKKPNKEYTIDRIDNNKGYEPNNCRWADDFTQSNNKRTNFNALIDGKTISCTQLARKVGKSVTAIRMRMCRRWDTLSLLNTEDCRHSDSTTQTGDKVCTECGVRKDLTEFNKRKSSKDGRNFACRECANARCKRDYWRKKSPYYH